MTKSMAKSMAKSTAKKKTRTQQASSKELTNKQATSKQATSKQATSKQATNKQSTNKVASIVADGRAWQKLPSPPLATAVAATEVSRLLALLNGAEVVAAGRLWRCRAQQLFSAVDARERVFSQGRWSLLLSLGDISCLCRTELPSSFRERLEAMSKPCRLEELPASVVLGLLSLALSPLLQELFLAECRLVEHGIDVEEKVCAKEEVAFGITVLPVVQEDGKEVSRDSAAIPFTIPFAIPFTIRLQIFVAANDLGALGRALRVRQWRREYPPNLHTTWQLDGGNTSLRLEEFRALREGDVLLLS